MSFPNKVRAVPTATPAVLDCRNRYFNHPISLICKAGAGGTMNVEFSNSPTAVDTPDDAGVIWVDSGVAITDAAPKEVVRYAPCVAIRVRATTAAGIVEQCG